MRGDVICHAVEVSSYQRRLPNGKVITVQSYRRVGSAAQLARNQYLESYRKQYADIDKARNESANTFLKTKPKTAEREKAWKEYEADKYWADYAYAKLKSAEAKWDNTPTSIGTALEWAKTDASEDARVAVGNAIEEAKATALTVSAHIENAVPKVKEAVSNGVQAVKSFFSRLFGRR